MHKIYFEKRCIIICPPSDESLSDPNAVIFHPGIRIDIATLVRMFEQTDSIARIYIPTEDTDSAYAVLGISPSATDDEVKAAYRRMAMKNHPDKVASLGPDVQKAAEEKFRKIQEAYETIKKQRGLN